MRKLYFIPLLMIFVFIGVFFIKNNANALTTLYSQPDSTHKHTDWVSGMIYQFLGNNLSGIVNEICIFTHTPDLNNLSVFAFNYQTTNPLNGLNFNPITISYFINVPTVDGAGKTCISIPEYNLNPNNYYGIVIGYRWGHENNVFGSNNSNAWGDSSSDCRYLVHWPHFSSCGSVKDIFFELNGIALLPPNRIDWQLPIPNTTTSPEVKINWSFHLEDTTPFLGHYTVHENLDVFQCASFDATTCITPIDLGRRSTIRDDAKIGTATTSIFLENGFYQIKNFRVGYDTNADGSVDSFIMIVPPSNVFQVAYEPFPLVPIIPTMPIGTKPDATLSITCDPEDGWFSYSFCKLFLYLFVPKQDAFDKFKLLSRDILKKPPLGYFTEIREVFNNVNAAGSPVFNIGNQAPLVASIFAPLRVGITWLLWLFFSVVIFNRIRHLEL